MGYQRNKHNSLLLSRFPETQHFLPDSIPRKENKFHTIKQQHGTCASNWVSLQRNCTLGPFLTNWDKAQNETKKRLRPTPPGLPVQNTHLTNADRFGICLTSCDTSSSFDRTTQMPLLLRTTLCGLIPNKSCFVCALPGCQKEVAEFHFPRHVNEGSLTGLCDAPPSQNDASTTTFDAHGNRSFALAIAMV